jgi:hypothetical protein
VYCATCGKPADNRVHCSWQPECGFVEQTI